MKKSPFIESDYNELIEVINKLIWSNYKEMKLLICSIFENSQSSKAKLFSKLCLYLCKETDSLLHKLIIINEEKAFSYKLLGDDNEYTLECKDVKDMSKELNKKFGFRSEIIRSIQNIVENINTNPNITQNFNLLSEIYKCENENKVKKNDKILTTKIIELLLKSLNDNNNNNKSKNECLYILLNGLYPSILEEESIKSLINEIINKIVVDIKKSNVEDYLVKNTIELIMKYNKCI